MDLQEVQHMKNEAFKKMFAYDQIYNFVRELQEGIKWRNEQLDNEEYSTDTKNEYVLEIETLTDIIAHLSKY